VSLGDDVVGGDLLAPGGVQVPRTHAGSSVGGAEGISAIVVVAGSGRSRRQRRRV